MTLPPPTLLAMFPPTADLVLDRVRRRTNDAMLWEIARADYGMEAEAMMIALRPIRDVGVIPSPLSGMLHEVLSLTHYSNPDVPNPPPFEPGPTGLAGHQARLFASVVLLRVEADLPPEGRMHTNSALAQALISANRLDETTSEALACHLTWRLSRDAEEVEVEDTLILALGLLILAVRLRSNRFSDSDLGAIANWVLTIEARESQRFPLMHAGPRPLPFGVQSGFWLPLAEELKTEARSLPDADVRTDLELCTLLLDPG